MEMQMEQEAMDLDAVLAAGPDSEEWRGLAKRVEHMREACVQAKRIPQGRDGFRRLKAAAAAVDAAAAALALLEKAGGTRTRTPVTQ